MASAAIEIHCEEKQKQAAYKMNRHKNPTTTDKFPFRIGFVVYFCFADAHSTCALAQCSKLAQLFSSIRVCSYVLLLDSLCNGIHIILTNDHSFRIKSDMIYDRFIHLRFYMLHFVPIAANRVRIPYRFLCCPCVCVCIDLAIEQMEFHSIFHYELISHSSLSWLLSPTWSGISWHYHTTTNAMWNLIR